MGAGCILNGILIAQNHGGCADIVQSKKWMLKRRNRQLLTKKLIQDYLTHKRTEFHYYQIKEDDAYRDADYAIIIATRLLDTRSETNYFTNTSTPAEAVIKDVIASTRTR